MEQQRMDRSGTWYHSIERSIERYRIEKSHDELKSTWKRHVKERIATTIEGEIRSGCSKMSKGRTVIDDEFKLKEYLSAVDVNLASDILKVRLHMSTLPCNYGDKSDCWLCGEGGVKTEHYLRCPGTLLSRECLGIPEVSLGTQETIELIKLGQFYKQLEQRCILFGKNNHKME